MRKIRLRYTGLVTFFSRILSLFTGLLFVVMVIRRIPPEDFGLWGILSVFIPYFLFPPRAISYWVTRYVARGFNVSKTGIYVNGGLALLCFLAYSIAAPYMAASVEAATFYFFLAGIEVLLKSIFSSLEAVGLATKPEVLSYSFMAFELSKIGLGIFAVVFLRLGLFGVILSIVLADLFQVFFLLFSLRNEISGNLNLNLVRKWFSLSWIPLFGSVAGLLLSLDTIILSSLTGSTLPKAFMEAPMAISSIISYSSLLAYALYPKILGGGSGKDVETVLKLVLLFAIPLFVGAFILASPLLHILRIEYSVTENILRVLVIGAFLTCISGIFGAVISGTERVELREDTTFRDYLKSRIFLLSILTYVHVAFYIPSVFLLTYYSVLNGVPYVSLVFYCVLSNLIIAIPIMLYKWHVAIKAMRFNFPYRNLIRYLIASGAMAAFLLLFYPYGAYSERILYVLSNLLPVVAVGAIIYLGIVYIIDKDTKALFNSIYVYLKSTLKK